MMHRIREICEVNVQNDVDANDCNCCDAVEPVRLERSGSWRSSYKSPMLKIAARLVLVPIAICILRRKGIGNSMIIRSVIVLNMPIVTKATL